MIPSFQDLIPQIQEWPELGDLLGCRLTIVREDLLPFPLAGNKVRKVYAELREAPTDTELLITTGAINSNHCRTVAMVAARAGMKSFFALHGEIMTEADERALTMLELCGGEYRIVEPHQISETLLEAGENARASRTPYWEISGGGHTPAGARAFKEIGQYIFSKVAVDQVFLASGTGATQGGLIAAGEAMAGKSPEVIGVSVARSAERGRAAVAEAIRWAGGHGGDVAFLDKYRAGGYGLSDKFVATAVRMAWREGLPLDGTYTGKAFSALCDFAARGGLAERVMFWHTGGLWNLLSQGLSDPMREE